MLTLGGFAVHFTLEDIWVLRHVLSLLQDVARSPHPVVAFSFEKYELCSVYTQNIIVNDITQERPGPVKYITSHIVTTPDLALNHNLFGGTLMTWCDQYGALFTYRYLHHTFVTYKIEKIYFNKPGKEGDLIDFYMDNLKFNKISVEFDIIAVNNENGNELIRTSITFVAIDRNTEKAILVNPFKFEKQEFEAFVKQRIKPPQGVKLPKISITKEPDLTTYKKKYISELYIQAYQDGSTAITMFQKDYGKLISVTEATDIISYMNRLIIAAQQPIEDIKQ